MAFRLVSDPAAATKVELPTSGSQAFTRGALVFLTYASDRVDPATSTTGTTVNLIGVAAETIASTATVIDVILLEPGQLWEVDTSADIAANQIPNRHGMTNSLLLNNSGTDLATTLGVFLMLGYNGAVGDRKAIGRLLFTGQVTA
jgi:hypothetical protein